MENLGKIYDRQIFYLSAYENNWLEMLPCENWLILPIADENDIRSFTALADKCIDKNVGYVCAAGKSSELMHDIFDELINSKKISKGESVQSPDDFINSPTTVWDEKIDEALWFAATNAFHEVHEIEKVVCVDFTNKSKQDLVNSINKINSGCLPG